MFSLSKPWAAAWLSISEWALLIFGIVLVGGLVGEYFADHKKKEYPIFKKRKRLFERMVIVGVLGELLADGGIFSFGQRLQIISDGENSRLYLVARQAEKEAAESKFATAKLEATMADSDRSKWPVYSLTAEVRLRIKSEQGLADSLNFRSRLTISQSSALNNKVSLTSDNAVNVAENEMQFGRQRTPATPPVYLLLFSNPFRPIAIPNRVPLFGGVSAKAVADEIDTISLQITNFSASNVEVTFGSATVIINDTVWKRFRFNPGTINDGFGFLTGSNNSDTKLFRPK